MSAATQETATIREWDGKEAIPLSEFGRDHWSTLAYLETRAVDQRGVIVNDHMRTNPRRHRSLVGDRLLKMAQIGGTAIEGTERHPTRLGGGVLLPKHDDWDCLNDAVEASLVEIVSERHAWRGGQLFGGGKIVIRMTESGMAWCAALRAHKARGGSFSTFCADSLEATSS